MKRFLFIILSALLMLSITACGEEEASNENEQNDEATEDVEKNDESSEEQKEKQDNESEDDEFVVDTELGKVSILGMYGNDDSNEEGLYEVDFEGFKLNILPSLVDVELNEDGKETLEFEYDEYEGEDSLRVIQLLVEAENTNDFDVDYNGDITIITNDGEQLYSDSGVFAENEVIQTYYGQVKEEDTFIFPIEKDSKPEEIKIILDPPYEVEDDAVDPEDGQLGEEERIEFDFVSKEEIEELDDIE